MKYNAYLGEELMRRYLGDDPKLAQRLEHSIAVGGSFF